MASDTSESARTRDRAIDSLLAATDDAREEREERESSTDGQTERTVLCHVRYLVMWRVLTVVVL